MNQDEVRDRHPRYGTFLVRADGKEVLEQNFGDVGPRLIPVEDDEP